MEPSNPYAPPQADVDFEPGPGADAEAIRRAHIKHEASLRSFGGLFLFAGVTCLVMTLSFMSLAANVGSEETPWVVVGLLVPLALAYFWVGAGLRRFDRGVRLGATLLAALGLLSFPFGTLLGGYLLYLLHGAKGKVVFGDGYPTIIAATTHIKRPTALLTWGLLGGLVLFLVAVFVLAVIDTMTIFEF